MLHNLPIAVDFFFILSGFLIIYLLLIEKSSSGTISMKKFYIRRVLRIFPLYYLIILIAYFFLQEASDNIEWNKLLYFAGNFWMIAKNSWTISGLNPLWSISIEEHFYLFIPALMLLIPTKYLKYLFIAIIVGSIVFRIYSTETIDNNWMTIYMHTFSQIDLMAIGGLLAIYHFNNEIKFNIPIISLISIVFALFILMSMVDSKDFSTVYFASIKKYLFTIPLLLVLILFVFNTNPILDGIKNNSILNYLGKISYGIYMYNAIIIDLLEKCDCLQKCYFIKFFLDVSLTLIAAIVSYEIFEKQFIKLKNRFQVVNTSKSK
jgi:peptidoglycan/LPS O-acetylase OafA/YrhL